MIEELPAPVVEAILTLIGALASYIAYRTRTNTGKIATIEEKVEQQMQTVVVVDKVDVAGQWSPEAKEALEKAIPVGAETVNVVDSPTYHIVTLRLKR